MHRRAYAISITLDVALTHGRTKRSGNKVELHIGEPNWFVVWPTASQEPPNSLPLLLFGGKIDVP